MQERAARTRRTLVSAAACEFDRNGYAGSSLTRIARSAGISTGALTFHFVSKEELAEAVRAQGYAETLAVVGRVTDRQEPSVRSVVGLTVALAGLLEDEVCVRAAARLTRDQPECVPEWTSAWVPAIHEHLRQSVREPAAGPLDDRTTLAELAEHLVAGAEADVRRRSDRGEDLDGRSAERIARIWDLVLRGRVTGRERGAR
ncbi:TetR family transcriptional regulator [Streptomyces sp. NPDC101733]|uniref:TetR family transcriptional regulator n=1 Tax=unclassified Streptomyces TaxID=2593676 RepID=UPI00381DDCBF